MVPLDVFLCNFNETLNIPMKPIFLVNRSVIWDCTQTNTWDKVFKNGPSKICGRQPFKKFYLVHSWIFCPTCSNEVIPVTLNPNNTYLYSLSRVATFDNRKTIQQGVHEQIGKILFQVKYSVSRKYTQLDIDKIKIIIWKNDTEWIS